MNARHEIAVIFTRFEYRAIPFSRLQQLAALGLTTIYILLTAEECQESRTRAINPFGDARSGLILDYYQSADSALHFEVMNTGNSRTEEDKLNWYLKNVQEMWLMNIFISYETFSGVCEEISAKPFREQITTLQFWPFFSQREKMIPLPFKPLVTGKALTLLQRTENPCLCYHLAHFDLIHYQWLYNIFMALIQLSLNAPAKSFVDTIYKTYKSTVESLEVFEDAFNKSHQEVYGPLVSPNAGALERHKNNTEQKESAKAGLTEVLNQIVDFYVETATVVTAHKFSGPGQD